MTTFALTTNITGNETRIKFVLSDVYVDTGLAPNLRNVVINLVMDCELLEHHEGENYPEITVKDLTDAANDG